MRRALVLLAVASALGCTGELDTGLDAGTDPSDGGATDGGVLDAGATDGGAIDGGPPDGGVLDEGATDGGAIDGGPPDGGVLDGGVDGGTDAGTRSDGGADAGGSGYDAVVLADGPVAFWGLARAGATEPDLTGNGNSGTYQGGIPAAAVLPNGDPAADFNGSSQYLTIASNPALSIPTTGSLTWEAWIRPDVLQFPNSSSGGYVDWMGKCASYSPTCEWEARLYNTTNPQGRCNRFSAYAFNPTAGLGSGADWQPTCGLIQPGKWYHVVGEYTTLSQPATCPNVPAYPGSLNIWVNAVPWNQAAHSPTGCMSQYSVVPVAKSSPLNIGTMSKDTWFQGAIGKVAIYGSLLSQTQITNHYRAMTGLSPSGSCAATCTTP